MSVQIANPAVVAKIERLAALTGLTKTAAVEKAVDRMLADHQARADDSFSAMARMTLAQFDRLPVRADAFDPLEWDEHGLPR
jgi:antitoxin VapB